jgi:hypothetical protein
MEDRLLRQNRKSDILRDFLIGAKQSHRMPKPDMARCSECGWSGKVSECTQEEDGDWESGYYLVDLCPNCEDGGMIEDYDMSPERMIDFKKWEAENA